MTHEHKFATTTLTTQLAVALLANVPEQIPTLTNEYAKGRTITDGNGVVYAVYVGRLREILTELGYTYPKSTGGAVLGSW